MKNHELRTALVTGGAGFIGSHLCEALVRKGFFVTAVDNFVTSSKKNIEPLLSDKAHFIFHKSSVLNETLMAKLVSKSDYIYHLAASVGVKYILDHPVESIMNNINGTEIILRLAAIHKKKVILASSSEVYGQTPNHRVKETDKFILGGTAVPRWHYATSKGLDEFLAHAYEKENGLKIIIARFFNTIGPRQKGRYGMVFPRFIQCALKNEPITVYGTGDQKRTFNYVLDAVRAVIDLSLTPAAFGQAYNVGSDAKPISIMNLAKLIKKRLKSRSKIVLKPYEKVYGKDFEDILNRSPDISLLKKMIGYNAQVTLEQMIDLTAEYLKTQKQRL